MTDLIPVDASHTCVCVSSLRAQRMRRGFPGIVMLSDEEDICIGITVPTFPVPLLFQCPCPSPSCPLSLPLICSLSFPLLCCLFLQFLPSNQSSFSSQFNFPPRSPFVPLSPLLSSFPLLFTLFSLSLSQPNLTLSHHIQLSPPLPPHHPDCCYLLTSTSSSSKSPSYWSIEPVISPNTMFPNQSLPSSRTFLPVSIFVLVTSYFSFFFVLQPSFPTLSY